MVFSSNTFLFVFLPCVLLLYFSLYKMRNIVLLCASLFFYMWGGLNCLLIMLASIAINFGFGLVIDTAEQRHMKLLKRTFLWLDIVGNLGILYYFKYFNFSVSVVNMVLGTHILVRNIVLPIGISFFTFQGLSYIVDLYRGDVKVQKNAMKLALYISCFPQLIAGPIVRYKDISEEIDHREVNIDGFAYGIKRFMIGLGKKVVISNTLALTADSIFNIRSYASCEIATLWLGLICYSLQIYFDFSGYSDMAIGLGRMFGFHFLENFNYPYISKSVSEFWRRWHISLSSFFRDYLYIPLGGNRKGNVYLNLFIVFLATGIWHGASMNFIVWGIWHGCFVIIERAAGRIKYIQNVKIPDAIKYIYTLLVVMIGWVLFRADNLTLAVEYIKRLFGIQKGIDVNILTGWYVDNYLIFILVIAIIGMTPFFKKMLVVIRNKEGIVVSSIVETFLFLAATIILFMKVMTSTYNPFIYFRF